MSLDLTTIPLAEDSGTIPASKLALSGIPLAPENDKSDAVIQDTRDNLSRLPSEHINKILDLSNRTGFDPNFVHNNIEVVQREQDGADFDVAMRNSPITANWLKRAPDSSIARSCDAASVANMEAHENALRQGDEASLLQRVRSFFEPSALEQTAQAENALAVAAKTKGVSPAKVTPEMQRQFARTYLAPLAKK